ncbi:hypothetical protein ACIRFH_05980 [Streptomyces sp. NPDC093586]|uniref:hypothetical protein n=1 Tax=Streptomyces sp. NPDC093586 TaxID=3366042 RepID=UPI00381A0F32
MLDRIRIALGVPPRPSRHWGRYARGLAAALVAVAVLGLAGNTGPARSAGDPPEGGSVRVGEAGDPLVPDVRADEDARVPRPGPG